MEGGLNHIGVIAGAQGLCEHVANSSGFNYGADPTTSDDPGTRGSRAEHDTTATVFTDHLMRNRVGADSNLDERLFRSLAGFTDGLGNFVGLAKAAADFALAIASNDERAEAKPATALHYLGASVDEYDLLSKTFFVLRVGILFRATLTIVWRCHRS